jgi:hypothetical protein
MLRFFSDAAAWRQFSCLGISTRLTICSAGRKEARTDKLIAAIIQWAEKIMWKIDNVFQARIDEGGTPDEVDAIAEHIREIGEQMVANYQPSPDVMLDKEQGIIPRCLIFEKESRNPHGQGSVVVGVNPGNGLWPEERQFYRECGCSYDAVVKFWPRVSEYSRYYKLLTGFLNAAGLDGPILWTELVKCESKQGTVLSIETIRKDINRYLFRELEKIPDDWPLIGIGRRAYEILAYQFCDRQVIGIPHPTSSHGQFAALFPSSKAIEPNAKEKLADLLRSKDTVAVWFSCSKGKGCRAE